jgi:hypothetical protein
VERVPPSVPMLPAPVERLEVEDKRHGAWSRIAHLDVATGHVMRPSLLSTRTDADGAVPSAQTIPMDPEATWFLVTDHRTTHPSETLVRLVAAQCAINEDLGLKGTSGILTSMNTRATFLSDPIHRRRFISTPRHSSWLHHMESWFSLLVRRLLARARWASVTHVREGLLGGPPKGLHARRLLRSFRQAVLVWMRARGRWRETLTVHPSSDQPPVSASSL